MADSNDSHLSTGSKEGNDAPVRQHHRMAVGAKVTGQANPNGAERGPTDNRQGNNQGKTY